MKKTKAEIQAMHRKFRKHEVPAEKWWTYIDKFDREERKSLREVVANHMKAERRLHDYKNSPLFRHQDLEGRIWDMLYMFALKARKNPSNQLTFEVVFQMPDKGDWERNEKVMEPGKKTFREVTLEALAGPTDIDDVRPAITIMKPGED